MIEVIFPGTMLTDIQKTTVAGGSESVAILLATPVETVDREGWRLLVHECHIAPPEAYEERTEVSSRVTPAWGVPYEKRARTNRWSIIYCHTHPGQAGSPTFSTVDDDSEPALAAFAESRVPGVPHVALVVGPEGATARRLGCGAPATVREVGPRVSPPAAGGDSTVILAEVHDRQIRAFGEEGQRRLDGLTIGIVGLGGTGSLVAQQLAHLGVSRFVLFDPDSIETTNLNRVVGSFPSDADEPNPTIKIDVAARMIRGIRPDAEIVGMQQNVLDPGLGRRLSEVDFLFSCTDSHGSRHLINQVAYQYYVPVIDLGVIIDPRVSPITIAGHVKMLAPGLACLWCIEGLDAGKVREDFMSDEQRAGDPYFGMDVGVKQPAVISINSTVAALAVTMFLSAVVGIPSASRYQVYDGNLGRVRSVEAGCGLACVFCSDQGTLAMGDRASLTERQ
jgi:hypothetical protein